MTLVCSNVGNRAVKDQRHSDGERSTKTGSDGWAIESLELIVNGRVIYQTTFPGGRWLDNSKGKTRTLVIPGYWLRTNPKWTAIQESQLRTRVISAARVGATY